MTVTDRQALNRFLLKASILFAVVLFRWREGASRLAAMLFFSAAVLNAIIAFVRADRLQATALTYWDEAVAFLVLSGLATAVCMGNPS